MQAVETGVEMYPSEVSPVPSTSQENPIRALKNRNNEEKTASISKELFQEPSTSESIENDKKETLDICIEKETIPSVQFEMSTEKADQGKT